MAKRK